VTRSARILAALAALAITAAAPATASAGNHVYKVSVSGTQTIDWTFSGGPYCGQTGTQKITVSTSPVVYELYRKPYALRVPGNLVSRFFPAKATTEAAVTSTDTTKNPDCTVGYGSNCGTDGPHKFTLYADFAKPRDPNQVMRIGKADIHKQGGLASENEEDIGSKLDCGGPIVFRKNDSPPIKNMSKLIRRKKFQIVSDRTFTTNFDGPRATWHYAIASHLTVSFTRIR
jgi:hypothetical protein